MIKTCSNSGCNKPFKTKDSRQKACSKTCADVCRSTNAWKSTKQASLPTCSITVPTHTLSPMLTLPSPEELPAPYAKRVYDMWAALIGDVVGYTRVA